MATVIFLDQKIKEAGQQGQQEQPNSLQLEIAELKKLLDRLTDELNEVKAQLASLNSEVQDIQNASNREKSGSDLTSSA